MKTWRILITMCIAIVLSIVIALPVAAADTIKLSDWSDMGTLKALYEKCIQSDNPDEYFAKLPNIAQQALIAALSQVEYVRTIDSNSPLTDGQTGVTQTVNAYSIPFGTWLYSFNQRIEWSYDGTYITGIYDHHSWGETSWPWFYQGLASESESGGYGSTYFQRYSQGIFELILMEFVVQSDYPSIDMTVYGDGSFF